MECGNDVGEWWRLIALWKINNASKALKRTFMLLGILDRRVLHVNIAY